MNFTPYKISEKIQVLHDSYIYRLIPQKNVVIPSFQPGQHAFLKNPKSNQHSEEHTFSIASSPTQKNYLEFCIKTYGDWSDELNSTTHINDTIDVSEIQGSFMWDSRISNAVFLLGGIGISPIMSMLRFIEHNKKTPHLTMIYGNRTPETVLYKEELEKLKKTIKLKLVDVYSHLPENHTWSGYRGFITSEIIKNEVQMDAKPSFFIIGPTIFVEKMKEILLKLHVKEKNIITEDV